MEVQLAWGRNQVSLHIPERNFTGLVKPKSVAGRDVRTELERALDHPLGESLEILCRGKRVCVLIEDDTRAEPHDEIVESLTSRLTDAEKTTFIVTTGSHDVTTQGNRQIMQMIRNASDRHDLNLSGIYINDCFSEDFVNLGTTSRGTRLNVNPNVLGADLYVVGADMKNHYFAGYSNALKDFLPGVCGYSTIEANHSWALDPMSTFGVHPLHPDPNRRNNPLAQDMLEAQHMITGESPVFALATFSSHGKLLWSGAGEMEEVTEEGIRVVDDLASFHVEKSRYAIISPGGYPQDDSLYNAQRALELTKNAVQDGGEVLLLAYCENGIAPNQKAKENFYERLTNPVGDVLGSIKSRYELYSHKAYKFAELIERLDSIHVYSSLDIGVLERAHLHKATDPQSIISGWVREDPDANILFFDDADKIAVHAK